MDEIQQSWMDRGNSGFDTTPRVITCKGPAVERRQGECISVYDSQCFADCAPLHWLSFWTKGFECCTVGFPPRVIQL